jgi:hypothetical protein
MTINPSIEDWGRSCEWAEFLNKRKPFLIDIQYRYQISIDWSGISTPKQSHCNAHFIVKEIFLATESIPDLFLK